ncbi:hypothetical protein [Streptomyces sp. A012304]|uniref:hypothetical protein n=1 Tax=Streptomyces sp. A012304 TaxID=375446 RepID=UPI0022320F59|nr:hypothetical protein [Streptomyces sp. A012304]GKQ35294.1 hypothetical protein ALMP_18390 [Streptomyces sp. A012304]
MKARVMSSLALPAALATAGLLSTAEAAYAAAAGSEPLTASARYAHQGQSIDGDVALVSADGNPCTPMGNVTITDYGHCCTPLANMTITDYSHCCTPVSNVIVCDYGHHQEHHDHGHYQVHDHDHGRRPGVA